MMPNLSQDALTAEEVEILHALKLTELERDIKVCQGWLQTNPYNQRALQKLASLRAEMASLQNNPMQGLLNG